MSAVRAFFSQAFRREADDAPVAARIRRDWIVDCVLFLLVALTGLSTFAKYTPYLPKTNPSHFVNHATKMKVAQSPVVLDRAPLYPVATVIPLRPAYRPRRTDKPVAPPIQLVGLTVSLQHRSPPDSLA